MAESTRTADEDFPVPMEQTAGNIGVASAARAFDIATTPPTSKPARGRTQATKSLRHCKYFLTKAGCKKGQACQYLHDQSLKGDSDDRSAAQIPGTSKPGPNRDRQSQQSGVSPGEIRHPTGRDGSTPSIGAQARRQMPVVDPSRIVRRPVPAGEITPEIRRKNEINQLKRRWGSAFEDVDPGSGVYRLELKQTEEFPYDLEALRIEITVPLDYPKPDGDGPTIRVLNDDIPRGYQINIEKGFANLVMTASSSTRLLDLLNTLDKRLEIFLSSEKSTTFKIVPNVREAVPKAINTGVQDEASKAPSYPTQPVAFVKAESPKPVYTEAEEKSAKARRELETRQMEARFRHSGIFSKNASGILYKVPLEPRMRNMLPVGLLLLKSVDLKVPELYPLVPCEISFEKSLPNALTTGIEKNFLKRATEKPEVSLMAQLNYLAQNIHNMLEDEAEAVEEPPKVAFDPPMTSGSSSATAGLQAAEIVVVPDKPHIFHIKNIKPPEWSDDGEDDDDDGGVGNESDSSSGGAEDDNDRDAVAPQSPHEAQVVEQSGIAERGTSISFPDIRLKNIELLELKTINITLKCTRCKTVADINNIKAKDSKHSKPKLLGCEKCANVIGIDYRKEYIHENHSRAGFLDMSGCTVVDLLPSEFVPTCAACSTTLTEGIKGVTRSQSMFTNCRSCFAKMSLFIPEIRFLKISEDSVDLSGSKQIRRQKENLGLVAGTELPLRGRCAHYRKSTRWFRFSCCNKVFPCDKCHDDAVEPKHPAEHANRMICGACSREQNYRPEDCAFCHHSFVSKNSGFWEGGKGTRDKTKMSRKDPRKYKRVLT